MQMRAAGARRRDHRAGPRANKHDELAGRVGPASWLVQFVARQRGAGRLVDVANSSMCIIKRMSLLFVCSVASWWWDVWAPPRAGPGAAFIMWPDHGAGSGASVAATIAPRPNAGVLSGPPPVARLK